MRKTLMKRYLTYASLPPFPRLGKSPRRRTLPRDWIQLDWESERLLGEIGAGSDYIYMNYAGQDQNPLRGYGEENLQHLKAIARKYDSTGVFQTRCPGGWKVSSA
jgi:hypothetical protein